MAILSYGQVGWRSASVAPVQASTLWTSVFGVWNADALGTSLDSNIFRVYNGDNVNDTSGNAQNGTNVNNVTFTTGKVGNAFTFNGSNYIQLPDNSLNSLTGDFSISMWFYPVASDSSYRTIISTFVNNGGLDYGFELDVIGGTQPYFALYGTSTVTLQRVSTFNLNQWNHFVVTRKASTGTKFYHNGIEVISNSSTVNPRYYTTMYPSIGALRYGVSSVAQYQGNSNKIDALTVWNKELTASEVFNLYNDGTGAEYPFTNQTLASLKDSVGSNDGTRPASTLTGGVLGPAFTTGKIGKAFSFDGINDYVSLPPNTLSSLTDFSISFWYNPSSLPAGAALVGNYTWIGGIDRGYLLYLNYGTLYFRLWGSSTVDLVASGTFSTNTWYHIVLTRKESTRSKLYINGSLNASNTSTVNPNYTTTNYNSLGASQYNATNKEYYCAGKMDAVSVWNRELTAADVTELYNTGTGKQYPN